MKFSILIFLSISFSGCYNHQQKTTRKPAYPLNTFPIGRIDLKMPGYYSIYYPKISDNSQNNIFFLIGDSVALIADTLFFDYVPIEGYISDSINKFQIDTIGDIVRFISTAEAIDPLTSDKRKQNLVGISFIEYKKIGYSLSQWELDSTIQFHILSIGKNTGYFLSKQDRDELIEAVKQSTIRKD